MGPLAAPPSAIAPLLLAAHRSFWQMHGAEISAAITVVLAFVIAYLVDRLVIARGARVADRLAEGAVSRTAQTRLRVVRRLVFVLILLIGFALALSQFAQIKRLATGILASSAVIGLVIGLAARQSLANMVAGVQMAITQPIRIGDRVTFGDMTGRVDDITLSYTYLDSGDGRLVVVPNEKIVSGTLINHSTGDRAAPIIASVWVPASTDLKRATEALKGTGADSVSIADWTPDGLRLDVSLAADVDRTGVGDEEAMLRERAQAALRDEGLLPEPA